MFLIEFNFWSILAILVAVAAAQVFGGLYYSRSYGVGKKWMKEVDITDEMMASADFKKTQGRAMVFSPVITLLLAYGLTLMIENLLVFNAIGALYTTLTLWLFFVVPTLGLNYLYNPNLSKKLFAIDILYQLLSMILMSQVIMWII